MDLVFGFQACFLFFFKYLNLKHQRLGSFPQKLFFWLVMTVYLPGICRAALKLG